MPSEGATDTSSTVSSAVRAGIGVDFRQFVGLGRETSFVGLSAVVRVRRADLLGWAK